MRVIAIAVMALVLAACTRQPPSPTTAPCGVIKDSLLDVQGRRASDVQRIDRHYARGKAAGCW